jgi:hypothetical protein
MYCMYVHRHSVVMAEARSGGSTGGRSVGIPERQANQLRKRKMKDSQSLGSGVGCLKHTHPAVELPAAGGEATDT